MNKRAIIEASKLIKRAFGTKIAKEYLKRHGVK